MALQYETSSFHHCARVSQEIRNKGVHLASEDHSLSMFFASVAIRMDPLVYKSKLLCTALNDRTKNEPTVEARKPKRTKWTDVFSKCCLR